jgi:type I restriction enzyme S subunit
MRKLASWKVEKLKKITTKIGSGATPLGGEKAYHTEGISLIRSLNVHDMGFRMKDLAFLDDNQADKLSNVIVESGDVLLNITGASVARCCIVPDDVLPARVNQHVSIIRLVKDEMSPEFLHYALISNEYKAGLLKTGEKGGSTRQAITKAQIEDFSIKYPPLPEQQRIVSVLDEAFASIAQAKSNAERNLVNARELFESYLKGVFETKSDDWEEKKLGDIGKVSMCKRVYKEQTTTTGDIPFYKIGTFGKEPDVFIPKSLYDEFRNKFSFPKKGDILISAAGTIGRRVKYDGEPAYFQDSNIVWIDNDEKQVLNDYLYQFYGACNWNSTTGATIPRLYNDNLRQIEIAFPKSLAEQRAIVGRLEALSAETGRLEEIYEAKVEGLEELKKSILNEQLTIDNF